MSTAVSPFNIFRIAPMSTDDSPETKPLDPAARRALAEAEVRRKARTAAVPAPEIGGRDGPEPTRYGDWEKNGIAHDF